jgi:hypothetical protein
MLRSCHKSVPLHIVKTIGIKLTRHDGSIVFASPLYDVCDIGVNVGAALEQEVRHVEVTVGY